MAHSLSAKKRVRQNARHRARNRWRMRTLRLAVRDFREKLARDDYAAAESSFRATCKLLDKTASKGVIHRNTAARTKSRLSRRLKAKREG